MATDTDDIVDTHDLAATVRHALLDEFAFGKELDEANGHIGGPATLYGIATPVAHMLDWLIRHHPLTAHHLMGEIIGDAERRMDIPRDVSADSIRTALELDSKLPRQARLDFLERALPPQPPADQRRRPDLVCAGWFGPCSAAKTGQGRG